MDPMRLKLSDRLERALGIPLICLMSVLPFASLVEENLLFWLFWLFLFLGGLVKRKPLPEISMVLWFLGGLGISGLYYRFFVPVDLLFWGRILLFLMTGMLYLSLNRTRIMAIGFQAFVLVLVASALNYRFWMAIYLPVFLWLLIRMLLQGDGPRTVSRIPQKMTLAILALAYLMFLMFPRMALSGIAGATSISGLSDSIEFGEMTNLLQSDRMVGRLFAPFPMRLRGQILDRFDGNGWTSRSRYRIGALSSQGEEANLPYEPLSPQKPYEVRIELLPSRNEQIVLPPRSDRLRPAMDLWFDAHGSVRRRHLATPREIAYEVTAYELALEGLPPQSHPESVLNRYLRLPRLSPRIEALSRQIVGRTTDVIGVGRALENWFQERFTYSLQSYHPGNPLEHFLFEDRSGHCEFFASAMAVMLRTLKIPSRVVTGYSVSEYNEFGDYYTIRSRDAHAWVELLTPQGHWIEFDPTPARSESAFSSLLPMLGRYADFLDGLWQNSVLYYSRLDQLQFLLWLENLSGIPMSSRRLLLGLGLLFLVSVLGVLGRLLYHPKAQKIHPLLRRLDRKYPGRRPGESPFRWLKREGASPKILELAHSFQEVLYEDEFCSSGKKRAGKVLENLLSTLKESRER